jgi:hypothetical protein
VDKSQIATKFKVKDDAPSLTARIASARAYRIIDGRGTYTLTEQGKRYFIPESESDKNSSLLFFLGSPSVFNKFIARYDGNKMPQSSFLLNVFSSQFGVRKSWAQRVASIFESAAELAGAVDAHGFLRYQASLKGVNVRPSHHAGQKAAEEGSPAATESPVFNNLLPPERAVKIEGGANVWVYGHEDKSVRLETPKEFPFEMWEVLSNYVQHVIKPTKKEKTK